MSQPRLTFVCGLHRSGTTPLAQILSTSADVSGFSGTGVSHDEGQFLQSVFENDEVHGGPGRFGFATAAHLTEADEDLVEQGRRRLLSEWSQHWDTSRPVLLEKSPSNLLRTRYLQAVFPDASFVVLVRHPIAVSLATRKWSRTGVFSLVDHWVRCHEAFAEDLTRLRQTMVVPYELLVADPHGWMLSISEHLGLTRPPAARDLTGASNAAYFEEWREHFSAGDDRTRSFPGLLGQLRERLLEPDAEPVMERFRSARDKAMQALAGRGLQLTNARLEAQDATACFEERVNRFGYSLVDLAREPSGDEWRA